MHAAPIDPAEPRTEAGTGVSASADANASAGADAAAAWLDGETAAQTIRHGDWSLAIDGASLDDIAYRGVRLLRGLRVVVRDHDWRTVPVTVDSVASVVAATPDTLLLTIDAHHDDLGVGVTWRATVALAPDRFGVEVEATATSAFRRNRLGIVVLHGPEVAGTDLRVVHPDAPPTETAFPTAISPHQPAVDIVGLRWRVRGLDASLDMNGDVFEMEDQRNWTDASFKTYSTPLSLPFPVDVSVGDTVRQSAQLTVSGTPTDPMPPVGGSDDALQARPAPEITVGATTAPARSAPTVPAVSGVSLLVELDATSESWSRVLARARAEAPGLPLDTRIVADSPDQVDAVVHALCGVPLRRVGVFDRATQVTTSELFDRLRSVARAENLTGTLVGGTRAHFTELNRRHDDLPSELPGVTFSITPQMHDTSRRQVLESLGMQRLVAEQAVAIAGGRPVHVGPVTLRARYNSVATSRAEDAHPHRSGTDVVRDGYGPTLVWEATDPRQAGRGYAAWLLASYQALAVAGVASVSYAEASGPRGFGDAGGRYPAATVLGWLADLRGAELLPTPLSPEGGLVVARRGGTTTVLASNLTAVERVVSVDDRELRIPAWGVLREVV